MRNKAFTTVQFLVLLVVLGGLVLVLTPVVFRVRQNEHPRYCQSNLKQIGLAIRQYLQDYDEKHPPVASNQGGWVDLLQPYANSSRLFQCPTDKSGFVDGTNDYFYNSRLAGVGQGKLKHRANIIMAGDGLGNSTTDTNLSELPANWLTDSISPAFRHTEGAHYLYADGRVKWLKAEKVAANALAIR